MQTDEITRPITERIEIDEKEIQEKYEINPKIFTECYLLTVKLGNENFEYVEEIYDGIFIGGYGLFQS
jgi:hypothetical protein